MAKNKKNVDLSGYSDTSYMDNTPDGNQGISPFRFGSRDQRLYTNLGLQAQIEAQPKILAFEGDTSVPPPDNGFPVFAVESDVYSFDDTRNKLSGTPNAKYAGANVQEPISVKVTDANYGGAMMSTDPEMIEGIYVTSRQGRQFLDTEGTPLEQIEHSAQQTEEEQFKALPRFGRGSAFHGFQTRMIGYGNGRDVDPELQGEYITSQAAEQIFDTDGTPLDSIGRNGETEEQQFEDLPQFGRGGAFGKFERVIDNSDEQEADPEDFKADEIFNIDNLSTIPRFNRPRNLNQQMTQFIQEQNLGNIRFDDLDDDEYITTAEADELYHPNGETIAQIAQESRLRQEQRSPYPPFGERGVFRNAPAREGLGATSGDLLRASTQPFEEFFKYCIKVTSADGTVKSAADYKVTNLGLFFVTLLAWAMANSIKLLKEKPLSYSLQIDGETKSFNSVVLPADTLATIGAYNAKYIEVGTAINSLITQLNKGEVLDPLSFEQECKKIADPLLVLIELYNTLIQAIFTNASIKSVLADQYVTPAGFLEFTDLQRGVGAITSKASLFESSATTSFMDRTRDLIKESTKPISYTFANTLSKSLINYLNPKLNPVDYKLYNDARLALGRLDVSGAYKKFVYLYRDIVKVFLELPLIKAVPMSSDSDESLLETLKKKASASGNQELLTQLATMQEYKIFLGMPQENGITLPPLRDVIAALVKQSQALRKMYQDDLDRSVFSALSDYVGQVSDLFNKLAEFFINTKEVIVGENPILLRVTKAGINELFSKALMPLESILKDIKNAQQTAGNKVVNVAGVHMDLTSYLRSVQVVRNLNTVRKSIQKIKETLNLDESELNNAISKKLRRGGVANAYRISLILELANITELLINTLYVQVNDEGVVSTSQVGLELNEKIDTFLQDADALLSQQEIAASVDAADDVVFSEGQEAGEDEYEYDEEGLVIIDTEDGETLYWDKDGKIGAVDFVYNDSSELIGRYADDAVIDLAPLMYEEEVYYLDQETGNVYTEENQIASPEIRRAVLAAIEDEGQDFEADANAEEETETAVPAVDTTTTESKPAELEGGSNTAMYIVGGLLLAGGAAWFMHSRNKSKK